MELFFEDSQRPWFWPQGAAVTQLAASPTWPPCITAVGYAPCLRAWKPEGAATSVQFTPVQEMLEVDGSHFVACCIQEGRLAAAEASGRIGVWDTATWKRMHTLSAGAEITALALSNAHLAVGTACGSVMVWQCEAGSEECKQVFVAKQVDTAPIRTVLLNLTKYAEGRLLVVHSAGRNSVNVWHLAERRLMHRLVRKTEPGDTAALVSANMQFAFLDAVLFAGVSCCEGRDPIIQLANVVEAEMQDIGAPERLAGRGRPLAADFAGGLLAVGFEEGALAVFGRFGWLKWHKGSVGAVKVLPHKTQVISGGADKQLCLWSGQGALLACMDVGFQITALAASDCSVAVGGAAGELQIAVLAAEQPEHTAAAQAQEFEQPPHQRAQYDLLFDFRPSSKHPQGTGPIRHGHASHHPDILAQYVRPRTQITAEHLAEHAAVKDGDAAAQAPEPTEEQREAAKRKSLQQMGESGGVARNTAAKLPSSVEKLGEKCANPNCLVRAGMKGGQFMRCASCKERRYCSQHCQRTHWRDGHSRECGEITRRKLERAKLLSSENTPKAPAAAAAAPLPAQAAPPAQTSSAPAQSSAPSVAPSSTNPSQQPSPSPAAPSSNPSQQPPSTHTAAPSSSNPSQQPSPPSTAPAGAVPTGAPPQQPTPSTPSPSAAPAAPPTINPLQGPPQASSDTSVSSTEAPAREGPEQLQGSQEASQQACSGVCGEPSSKRQEQRTLGVSVGVQPGVCAASTSQSAGGVGSTGAPADDLYELD